MAAVAAIVLDWHVFPLASTTAIAIEGIRSMSVRSGRMTVLALAALIAAIVPLGSDAQENRSRQILEAFQQQLKVVAEKAGPSIVGIVASRSEHYPPPPAAARPGQLGAFDPREFIKNDPSVAKARLAKYLDLSDPQAVVDHGIAAGVVIDKQGLILTPYHVVAEAKKIYVHVSGGGGSYADIHAADAKSDLAVLKLLQPPEGLKPIRLADVQLQDTPSRPATIATGQLVVLMAHPVRAEFRIDRPSMAYGMVTNTRFHVTPLRSELDVNLDKQSSYYKIGPLLEYDIRPLAAISGAALLNLDGELVGLATVGAVVYDRTIGPGYALPLDANMRRVLDVLRRGEEVEYGFLGVTLTEIRSRREPGVEIGAVTPGGPADAAGIRPGDLIIRINGFPVDSYDHLLYHIGWSLAGSTVELTILPRLGPPRTTTATLAKFLNTQPFIATVRPPACFGLRVDYKSIQTIRARNELSGRTASMLPGVCIREVEPNSPAEKKFKALGEPIDRWLIIRVNDTPVSNPVEFYKAVDRQPRVVLTVVDTAEAPPRPREVVLP